jgi:hypothetical protein
LATKSASFAVRSHVTAVDGVPRRGEAERGQSVVEGVDHGVAPLLGCNLAADLATGRLFP